jgi:Zn-dependent protease
MQEILRQISVWAIPILAAVILHEIAHGWVANRLGDPTAKSMGRLTLNPLPHIDPMGTVALPLILIALHSPFVFGWARPVPVNFGNLRNPKRDMIKVAAAGPLTNVLLACLCAAILHFLAGLRLPANGVATGAVIAMLTPIAMMATNGVIINVVLAVFNMMPILPLDGGRVLTGLLPRAQAIAFSRLEPYGMLIVMALLFTDTLDRVIGPVVHFFLQALL